MGAVGRPSKFDVKDSSKLLVYYRLNITYTLYLVFHLTPTKVTSGDIQKMEPLIRNCLPSIPQKIYNITKRLKTPQEVEKYFPGGFLSS